MGLEGNEVPTVWAEALVEQFQQMVRRDGGTLSLLGLAPGVVKVGYTQGADSGCADGTCMLPPAELEQLMTETVRRRSADLRVEVRPI
jgi:Fe-S cluster biogenesis protein NfuA